MEEPTISVDADSQFPTKFAVALVIALLCVTAIGAALIIAIEIFLTLFLGVLFGVALTRLSRLLSNRVSCSYELILFAVIISLLLVSLGGLFTFGVKLEDQLERVSSQAEKGVARVRELADKYPSLSTVLNSTPLLREVVIDSVNERDRDGSQENRSTNEKSSTHDRDEEQDNSSTTDRRVPEQGGLSLAVKKGASTITKVFKTSFGLVVNSAIIFFVGIFLAMEPIGYRDGMVQLVPVRKRERACEVLNLMGDALWNWLLGRLATMLITGIGAGVLLAVLEVPMAITLGAFTAILTFIPNLGGVIALILAILFSLPQGGSTALFVLIGFIILQIIESYVVTPLIQKRQIAIPPALLISSQAVMGVLFGFLGAAVASPLLAATKVGVQEVYVRDYLERHDTK